MPLHYLFGPVSRTYADDNLAAFRESGVCRCFSSEPGLDVQLGAGDSWQNLLERLPPDWRPDFVVVQLQYNAVPPALWQAPVPVIGLAGDWIWQWHSYRRMLAQLCDLVLTDTAGVEALERCGCNIARPACLFGAPRPLVEETWPAVERDIDVLHVGNMQPAVQRARMPYLGRLAGLSPRWHVMLRAGVFGAEYRQLLARARIVFNRASRGEFNLRVGEAIAAGALLFQEEGNREVAARLRAGEEYVAYRDDNLEALLERYLRDEPERARIAEAARLLLPELTFARFWSEQVACIEADWPALCRRAEERRSRMAEADVVGRVWQAISGPGVESSLKDTLEAQLAERPRDATLLNARGVVALTVATQRPEDLGAAANAFQEAWSADPRHAVAGLNLAETLRMLNQPQHAVEHARRVLATLEGVAGLPAAGLDDPLAAHGFDVLRVEWERAAWQHAGDAEGEARAKQELLRWRLQTLLGELTGDIAHFYAACLLRPDLPVSQAALGLALARQRRPADALPHLEAALRGNPFDHVNARVLHGVLGQLGQSGRQLALARERRRLGMAAPGLVPVEPRFAEAEVPAELPAVPAARLRIVWQGAQAEVHSLALVNRNLCAALAERGHELSLLPPVGPQAPAQQAVLPASLAERIGAPLSGPVDVQVSHQWPPDFTPPRAGRWVVIQPWEFGSIPRAWLAPLRDRVDELWVPSNFVCNGFVQDGVPAAKVHVVPNGVAEVFFQDELTPYPLQTQKRCKLLFVGGTLHRKGFDLLLKAYRQVFCDRDDVCLVVKDMGVGSFYQGQTAEKQIEQVRRLPHAPEIEYLAEPLSEEQMAALYRACDVVVLPYRGEGFCLPAAEGMASGRAVIVTGFGPVLDYATDETAYLLPYEVLQLRENRVDRLETVQTPFLAEPDSDRLRLLLRHVYEHPEEARERGRRAREYVRERVSWTRAALVAEQRLAALRAQPAGELPAPADVEPRYVLHSPLTLRQRVSFTLIVKNEADNLPDCIGSFADLADEIIVVDTGSTDDTVAIARRLGARVYHFPWIDHFAAARNEMIKHATGEWIFWMDADDRLDAENRERLRRLLENLPSENVAYVLKVLCPSRQEGNPGTVVDHVRLFRNLPGLTWQHRIHEQILPSLRRSGATTRWADVVVHHLGYQDPKAQPAKQQRNLRILLQEYAEQPEHPFTLFNLGLTYREMGRVAEALDCFRRSLRGSAVADSIVRKLYASIVECEQKLERPAEALAACREGRGHYPDDAELLLRESALLDELGDLAGATQGLERLLASRDTEHFASVSTGLRGFATRHSLGTLYLRAGRLDDAEAQFQQALAEQPKYLPAVYGLADVRIARCDGPGLTALLARLRSLGAAELELDVLRARQELSAGNYAAAKRLLTECIARDPKALSPRVALCEVLLKEGIDWAAAEQALRAVLAIDPKHATCRKNLGLLLRQQGR